MAGELVKVDTVKFNNFGLLLLLKACPSCRSLLMAHNVNVMQEAAGRRRRLISFSPRAFLRLVIASDQHVAAVSVDRWRVRG